MKIKIKSYRDNDLEDGESILIVMRNGPNALLAARDVDRLIDSLTKARDAAMAASVDDEPQDFSLDL